MRKGAVKLSFGLWLLLVLLSYTHNTFASDIVQPQRLVAAQLGDNVTLTCIFPGEGGGPIAWYKQPFGQKPQLMGTFFYYLKEVKFSNKFKDNAKFSLQWIESEKCFDLKISNIEKSDAAVYYCGIEWTNDISFGDGTSLILRDSHTPTVVQQPLPGGVHPGDSVTLQCTVDGKSCAGGHRVYWFRSGSEESLPGLIYTQGNGRDECEKSPEAGSPTRSCVYSLPRRNLSRSDTGIYYCAVATCGHILFGNGTVVDAGGFDCASQMAVLFWLSIVRVGVFVCILLMFVLCYHHK